jgi:hypothetical protein
MNHLVKNSSVLLLLLAMFSVTTLLAQREPSAKVQQVKELPKSKVHITKELEQKIIEVVRPVTEQLEKLVKEDLSGNFKSYTDEVGKLKSIKNNEELKKAFTQIQKKYYPFIKKLWDQAKIDDNMYQQKLRQLFPADQRETIRFTEFLNFTMGSPGQKPEFPPAPPPPAPKNICIDANTMFRGSFGIDGGGIGDVTVLVVPANPPSQAEIVVSAGCGVVGNYRGQGWLRNSASIPGTFPFDGKSLRCKKTFGWTGIASAVAALGLCWSTVAYSTTGSTDFATGGEIYTAVAPVLWFCTINKRTSRMEETLIAKTDLPAAQFGITCYGQATSSVYLSYAHATSGAGVKPWEICEE